MEYECCVALTCVDEKSVSMERMELMQIKRPAGLYRALANISRSQFHKKITCCFEIPERELMAIIGPFK